MKIKKIKSNGNEIAIVNSDEVCISDVQSALDFMMSVNYETGSHSIVLNKEAVIPDFFVLSTRIIMPPVVKTRKNFSKLSSFPCSKNLGNFISLHTIINLRWA